MKKLLFFVLLLGLQACKDPEVTNPGPVPVAGTTSLNLQLEHYFGNEAIVLNQFTYNTGQNTLGFSNIQYFISGVQLKKADGSWISVPGYAQFTAQSISSGTTQFTEVPKGLYEGIRFNIGVDSVANHTDPSIWPNGHPLSIMEGGPMHWSWNSGYIFIKVEGQYEIPGNPMGGFAYHIGRDDLLLEVKEEGIVLNLQENPASVIFRMDLKKYFNDPNTFTVSPETSFTHSTVNDTVADQLFQNMHSMMTLVAVNP